MEIRELEYIYAIYEHKTITKAAQSLYITQPSLSIALSKIENELGVSLFERHNKKMIPTFAGEQCIIHAKQILMRQEDLLNQIKQISSNQIGKLRIASTPARSNYVLPAILSKFNNLYPEFSIECAQTSPFEALDMLNSHAADFALLILTDEQIKQYDSFEYTFIAHEEIVVCTYQDNPIKNLAIEKEGFSFPWIDINLLQNETFVMPKNAWIAGNAALELLSKTNFTPRSITLASVEVASICASRGLGIAFCPDLMHSHGTFTNNPVFLSCGDVKDKFMFVIVQRKNFVLTKASQDFISIVLSEFSKE